MRNLAHVSGDESVPSAFRFVLALPLRVLAKWPEYTFSAIETEYVIAQEVCGAIRFDISDERIAVAGDARIVHPAKAVRDMLLAAIWN